jgi:PAS domain S-box-containing protein
MHFEIAESEVFEPYVPFVVNFANMLAVIFEERAQRKLNQTFMEELEQLVTERTRELLEKTEDLRITLNSIGDAVISTDLHGKITSMNPVAEKLTGWQAPEAAGKTLNDVLQIINTNTLQPAFNPVEQVLATGEIIGLANHTSLIAKDGIHRYIADSASPIRDNQGGIRGVVLVFRDVTDEYQVAEALKTSEEKYRRIVEETSDLIVKTDHSGVITYVNHCAGKIFGIPPGECPGKSAFDFVHPEDQEKTRKWFRACIDTHRRQGSLENRQVNQVTQETFQFLWTCDFHYDEGGRLVSVNSVGHDITERKRMEEEKYRLEAQLKQAQKMESVGQLAGGVAHDFNNMLGVILGHTEMAMDQVNPDEPLFVNLEEIRKAATRSAEITRQLLAFASKQIVVPRLIDLNEIVETMLKILRRLIGDDIELAWLPRAGSCSVKIDPEQIDQILANLCINARDAIDGTGRITIETNNRTFDQEYCDEHPGVAAGNYVMLAVSDNGQGIDREALNHIFEPFFTTRGVGDGTGLGLATVYGIVKQNNGFINVSSEPAEGTIFRIYLPLQHGGTDQPSDEAKQTVPGEHETILLVEDEQMFKEMTAKMLEHLGYTVLTAASPVEALELAGGPVEQIQLLLTDVIMPGMNGYTLAELLLTTQPGMRCLFMSGYTADVLSRQFVVDEQVYFIHKPFSLNTLAAKVREALEGKCGRP